MRRNLRLTNLVVDSLYALILGESKHQLFSTRDKRHPVTSTGLYALVSNLLVFCERINPEIDNYLIDGAQIAIAILLL
jgi:hypothetical protein